MFNFIRNWLDQRVIQRSTITPVQWEQAFSSLPLLKGLTSDEKQTLRELAILFLHHKAFEGAQGFVVTRAMALTIALQACLPILKLGFGRYAGWVSVIVYPSGFAPTRTITDEAGVEHKEKTHLLGESWQRGPVVLAWDETAQAGIIDGQNLVIHEFAHKLDMQNGVANGFPPLHKDMKTDAWVEAFTTGYEDFQQKCDNGIAIDIDCYAATSPAEYFAVLSEVFFEHPNVLLQHYAAIYEQLRQYYRQDPLVRLN
jgi:Mlc titration factor MtfA (ptsG expression regulator)